MNNEIKRDFMRKYEFFMALRYIGSRKKEGFVSLITLFSFLGIFLGVAVLIIVTSIFNGFRSELIKSFIGIDGHISITAMGNKISHYPDVIKNIESIHTIDEIRPVIDNISIASFADYVEPANIRAYGIEDFKKIPQFAGKINPQALENLSQSSTEEDLPHAIIGRGLAYKLGIVEPGARISLMSIQPVETAFGPMPTTTDFLITDIFDTGNLRYDNFYILLSLEKAAWFYQMSDDTVTKIDIITKDIKSADYTALEILNKSQENLYIDSWRNRYGDVINALDIERNVAFIIVSLVILIAALNIVSSLVMLVNGKIRDIGILRTQGCSQKQIRNIFLIAGSLIGFVGTICGLILGLLVAFNAENIRLFLNDTFNLNLFPMHVYNMAALPSEPDAKTIIIFSLATLLVSVLASSYPAMRASRIDPAEALKHD